MNDTEANEVWRPIAGAAPGWEVSDLGRLRNDGGAVKAYAQTRGRRAAWVVYADGRRRKEYVGRLVLTAFVGEPTSDQYAVRADGDAGNDRLTNLSWGSRREDMLAELRPVGRMEALEARVERLETLVFRLIDPAIRPQTLG